MSANKDEEQGVVKEPISRSFLACILLGLIVLGCCNFVLLKILYTAYGDEYAFFVNQGVNLLYIIYGGIAVYPRWIWTKDITPEMVAFPHRIYFCMALLDALGTFFTAMGSSFTPGPLQPLLNQTLIPFTMLFSAIFIRTRYGLLEFVGAGLILCGAAVSTIPNFVNNDNTGATRWYSIVIYFCSNIPMACSAVYKETNFNDVLLDVWFLTQWVSIYQFAISFLFMPMLLVPGFGSEHGTTWAEMGDSMSRGVQCFLQLDGSYTILKDGSHESCSSQGTFWLLTGYTLTNICFNTLGLYLTKVGSAVLNSLAYALLVPGATLAFCLPFLGKYQESIQWETGVGLLIVMVGFGIYQHFTASVEGTAGPPPGTLGSDAMEPTPEGLERLIKDYDELSPRMSQPSFQERVIGMGKPHRTSFANSFASGTSLSPTAAETEMEPLIVDSASTGGSTIVANAPPSYGSFSAQDAPGASK